MDLPTADEPAGISTTEEAGLWLRFLLSAGLFNADVRFCAKKKPAGIDRRASTVAGAALVEFILRAEANGLEGRLVGQEAARTEILFLILRIAVFETKRHVAGDGRFQAAADREAA